jgi:hypothetical protein
MKTEMKTEKKVKDYTFDEVCLAFALYIENVGDCQGVDFIKYMDSGVSKTITELIDKEYQNA